MNIFQKKQQKESEVEKKGNNYGEIIAERITKGLAQARKCVGSKDVYGAISAFTKVIFLRPNVADTYKELGDFYLSLGDINIAITLYKKANQLTYSLLTEDKLKDLLFRKGFMLLLQGEHSDLLEGSQTYESFSRALRYDLPALSNAVSANSGLKSKAFQHFMRAYCYVLTYHKQYALEEVNLAINSDDTFVYAYLLKGKILWSMNKSAEGNEIFWKAESMANEHPEVKEFLKIIVPKADELLRETRHMLVQNELEKCLLNVKRGLELFPNNMQFLLIKAFVLRKSNEYENSLNTLLLAFHSLRDKSLEFEVKNQIALTYNEMGQMCFANKQYDEAINLFNESLQFKPNDWGVFTNRGDCQRMMMKIDDALKDYLKAQKLGGGEKNELNDRIALMRNSRGIVLFNQAKYEKALKEFNEALKANSTTAQFYVNRAKCYIEMGNMTAAVADYMESHKLDPKNAEVAAIVNKLKQESLLRKKDQIIKLNTAVQ